ncbi:DUF2237 domain-containing protein [Endozoicomonas gorgoniicola]|uniref:DUF2237 domain-containing protein n=1 Tax=Endozoicomonas gorgoniicola TaxID=1234144 RepID=A0ABT3MUQ7_9GAMM|nr:DUF2237 domain-containing protein [Endozoicomonas gorgoniicola]MCW7553121.1 DUF2237 domain-containing protein [Endozoicomonas gorgoniicola]
MKAQTSQQKNVFGEPLQPCCFNPATGVFRDGFCHADSNDPGLHVVCARMTREFLEYSLLQGNDLITPKPEFDFPGLQEGDRWCLCAMRWKQAFDAGLAPPVYLKSTHKQALEVTSLQDLKSCAIDIH